MALKTVTRSGGEVVCTCGHAFAVPWAEMRVTVNDVLFPPCPACGARMTHVALPLTENMLRESDAIIRRMVLNQNLHSRAVAAGAGILSGVDAAEVRQREYDLLVDDDVVEADLPAVVVARRQQYLAHRAETKTAEEAAAAVRAADRNAEKQRRVAEREAVRQQLRERLRTDQAQAATAAQAGAAAQAAERVADRQARLDAAQAARQARQDRVERLQAAHAARVQAFQEAAEAAAVPEGAPPVAPRAAAEALAPAPTAENTYVAAPVAVRPDGASGRRTKGK